MHSGFWRMCEQVENVRFSDVGWNEDIVLLESRDGFDTVMRPLECLEIQRAGLYLSFIR